MLSSVIVTDAMIRGKSFQNQTHVYFSVQSYLKMQIKLGTSLLPRSSVKVTNPRPEVYILGQRFKSSAESFKQGETKILINIITILFICVLDYFKDQIWWKPRPDIWTQEPRPRKCRLFFKSRLKPLAGCQDPRPSISDVRPDIWNSDTRHDVVIC